MVEFYLKFTEEILLTVVSNRQLIFLKKLDMIEDIAYYLKGMSVENVHCLFQGNVVNEIPDDAFVLSSFSKSNNSWHFVVSNKDIELLRDLCTSVNVKGLYVYSYFDYIKSKFKYFDNVIVVDNYFNNYCIMYLNNGVMKDYYSCDKDSLIKRIAFFKKIYSCPTRNAKDKLTGLDIPINENYMAILSGLLSNNELIPEYVLINLDFISYFYLTKSKSIISETDFTSIMEELRSNIYLDEEPVTEEPNKDKPLKKERKGFLSRLLGGR